MPPQKASILARYRRSHAFALDPSIGLGDIFGGHAAVIAVDEIGRPMARTIDNRGVVRRSSRCDGLGIALEDGTERGLDVRVIAIRIERLAVNSTFLPRLMKHVPGVAIVLHHERMKVARLESFH